ncbi:hypothetical protein KEJ27_09265 [Candidatus Bathyarchaeota archaeon]|nr:hypothetical protein [Candidatus Bathyarchaeota archaeon]
MVDIKISIIGAGSAVFSLSLIRGVCITSSLEGSTISFMDINKERLDAVFSVCKRYADEMNAKLKLEKTMDRRESLEDADFVINTALAAGHHRLREGWNIAKKHDFRFGGSHHIMHDEAFWINFYQFRLFESIVDDILDICPDAWYIQLANPVMAGMTYLGRKYRNAKIVGLCTASTGGDVYYLAKILGLETKHISFQIPGLNHFIWLTHFYYKGEDAFPILDEWIKREEGKIWKTLKAPTTMLIAIDLYKKFHAYPIGDTCDPGGGAWPWWYYANDDTMRKWKLDAEETWRRYFSHLEKDLEKFLEVANDPSIKVTDVYPPTGDYEREIGGVVSIIESIACNIPRIFQVNIMNSNYFVPGIPQDFAVEIPALVSKAGIQGIKTYGLPKALTIYAVRDRVMPVNMELEAYESGSRDLLLQLILMDPWARSEEQAETFLNDILALPYHGEMKEHYR